MLIQNTVRAPDPFPITAPLWRIKIKIKQKIEIFESRTWQVEPDQHPHGTGVYQRHLANLKSAFLIIKLIYAHSICPEEFHSHRIPNPPQSITQVGSHAQLAALTINDACIRPSTPGIGDCFIWRCSRELDDGEAARDDICSFSGLELEDSD
jgi:hypothetical protein